MVDDEEEEEKKKVMTPWRKSLLTSVSVDCRGIGVAKHYPLKDKGGKSEAKTNEVELFSALSKRKRETQRNKERNRELVKEQIKR